MSETAWHILGAGAMGCLWAHHLQQAGYPVTLVQRQAPSDRAIVHYACDHSTQPATLRCIDHAPDRSIHHLMVTTKATDTVAAVQHHNDALADDACVVLLQNGMGQQQALLDTLSTTRPDIRLYAGLSTEGAWLRSPLHVVHAGRGITRFGSLNAAATENALMPHLQGIALDIQWEHDITTALWLKLAINCAINALTAIYRCPNGELLDNGPRQQRMQRLCNEVTQVMQAEDILLPDHGIYAAAVATAHATARNRSSTLQDVLAGRRTELEALNGFVVQRAMHHGIATPENIAVLSEINTAFTPHA